MWNILGYLRYKILLFIFIFFWVLWVFFSPEEDIRSLGTGVTGCHALHGCQGVNWGQASTLPTELLPKTRPPPSLVKTPILFVKALLPNTITCGIRFQHGNFGEDFRIQFTASLLERPGFQCQDLEGTTLETSLRSFDSVTDEGFRSHWEVEVLGERQSPVLSVGSAAVTGQQESRFQLSLSLYLPVLTGDSRTSLTQAVPPLPHQRLSPSAWLSVLMFVLANHNRKT